MCRMRRIAVSGNRVYLSTDATGTVYVIRKPTVTEPVTGSLNLTDYREATEDIAGGANGAGLFYDRTTSKLWSLAFSGSGSARTWKVQSYDFDSSTWSDEFDLPGTGRSIYGGLVVTSNRVMVARLQERAVHEFDRSGTHTHTYDVPGLYSPSGVAGDVASGRMFYKYSNQIGYFRPLPTHSLQTYADALLTRYARSVRRLSLTLKPRTDLLPLPYASLVAVPAGTWGAAGNWHLQSWDISLDTRKGWVHKLDLTDYPRRADTRIWQRLTD